MARTSATISVGADTRQLERDIQSALSRDFKFKGFNEKAFTQPLGRITGAANEFQKSLDASNARVIAFGASAGLIYTVEKAFSSLVKSTIDVQKSLTDINVILNVSSSTLDKFGGSLFDIAKNTGQTFDVVAQAATELSRQGLGLEETLKRTQDALILTRLSGLDTVSAVEALTATINSFNKAGLDSTVIINKLANVDAAFAVSSGDLAEAIKRVGSSAQDVGVDFDELLAIVTSVQQTTARGGAVIGNSLKTIFTRIQRTDTLDQLENLGIKVRDLEGNTLPAIQILSNLSNTFNNLASAQKAQVAETVGGVFQINILRAALADLGKEYSVYDRALQTSITATDEAIQRNEALNQTLSALINQTFQNLTRVASDIGKISLGPTFGNTLKLLNAGLESLTTDSDTIGGKIGKGILEGIGTFISGPGVILITAVFGKLLLNLGKFASQSLQTLLNINTQAQERAQIQTKINQVLAQEPNLVAAIYNKQISVLDVEQRILGIIRQQTLERERAAAISTTITRGLVTRGVTTKGGSLSAKSGGFIPNFSAAEIYGALAGGYMPGNIRRMNIPGEGNITYNTAETVKNFPGMSQPAIMPPEQSRAGKNYQKQFSKVHGFNPYVSSGFIPNFAAPLVRAVDDKELRMMLSKFEKNFAFQNISDAQSVKAYSSSGAGTYMWDANSRAGISGKPQISDKEAYKQNIKRAKNWASIDNSSWLVRYNRDKLKNSELLPDMETGGASIYLNPLNKDQIIWPIKRVNGPGRIFEKDISRFLNNQINNFVNSANGFIPNFASYNVNGKFYKNKSVLASAIRSGKESLAAAKKAGYISSEEEKLLAQQQKTNNPFYESLSTLLALRKEGTTDGYTFKPQGKPPLKIKFPVVAFNRNSIGFDFTNLETNLDKVIDQSIEEFANSIYRTKKVTPPIDLPSTIEAAKQKSEGLAGAVQGTIGGIFEAAFRAAFGRSVKATKGGGFDVQSMPESLPLFFPGALPGQKGDFKNSDSGDNRKSMAFKILKNERPDLLKYVTQKNAAAGFVPNFAALDNAIGREIAAGTSISRIRIGKDARLTSSANPLGLGVYNTKDEPLGLGQGIQRYGPKAKTAGAANGFIPNFAGLTFTPGGLGSVDPAVASKEVGAQFAKIVAKLKSQEITIDQANANLKKLSSTYGLAADSQNRFNQIIQSRNSQFANSSKEAVSSLDKFNKGFSKLGNGFLALSLVLPIALQTVSQFNEKNKKLQVGIDAFSTALSLGFAGAAFGPIGAAGGLAAGAGLGLFQYIQGLKNIDINELNTALEELQQKFNEDASALQKVLPLLEEFKRVQGLDIDPKLRQETLDRIESDINQGLSTVGDDIAKGILNSIKSGNYEQAGTIISKELASSAGKIRNVAAETAFKKFKISGGFEKVGGFDKQVKAAEALNSALLGLQTETGETAISKLLKQEGGKAKVQEVITKLKDLRTARTTLIEKINKQEKDLTELSAQNTLLPGDLPPIQVTTLQKDINDSQEELKRNYNAIIETTRSLFQSSDRSAASFEQISNATIGMTESAQLGDIILADLIKRLNKTVSNQKKLNEAQDKAIQDVNQYILRFTQNTLNARDAQQFYKERFKLQQDPLKILGKNQNDLNESVAQQILNEDARNRVIDQLTIEEDKLREKLANRQITEDQYNKALEGLKDKIILEQRRQGTIFAEDFRGGRQTAREARALAGQTQLQDFTGAFFDEFDNTAADSFRQAQLGAKDTAGTIKSEFNNAFFSFAKGTESASDAFTKMALNISDKIQQLALEFSTNLIFGQLFGTTSNIFGGGGGGIGKLFGFNKGGLIKGYSSGGNVTGGSGTKDDVPAMLSAGEYVIRKSAVKKYGPEYLQMLNEGKVSKKFFGGEAIKSLILGAGVGGILGSILGMQDAKNNVPKDIGIAKMSNLGASVTSNGKPLSSIGQNAFNTLGTSTYSTSYDNSMAQRAVQSVSPATSVSAALTPRKDEEENFFKYGGRVQKFATGGDITANATSQGYGPNTSKFMGTLYDNITSGGGGFGKVGSAIFLENMIKTQNKNMFDPQPLPTQSQGTSVGIMNKSTSNYRDRNSEYFKYGGRVQRFARGGEASFIKDNYFTSNFDAITVPETGQTLYRPKEGQIVADNLNIRAILDSNNPQNEARKRAEDFYINRINEIDRYLEYVDGVRKANEEAYAENQRQNQEIRDQYNKQKNAASRGAWIQALVGLAGVGLSFAGTSGIGGVGGGGGTKSIGLRPAYKSPYEGSGGAPYAGARLKVGKALGGEIKKFANGGSNTDNIPALLMDGEFVMRREAVNLYGKKFFNELNSGRIKKFADGGEVGQNPMQQNASSNYSPTNNVSVVVNISKENIITEKTKEDKSEGAREEAEKNKELAEKVKTQVIRVITEQQRPGGLLSSAVYRKIS